MKKLALTIVSAMAMTGAAFAQGYVNWAIPTGDVTFVTNSTVFSPLFGGGSTAGLTVNPNTGLTSTTANSFDYALLYQSTPTGVLSTDHNVWDGTWSGGTGNTGTAMTGVNSTGLTHGGVTPATVNGQSGNGVQVNWANLTTNSIVLVGWSANMGGSWAVVSNLLANWSTLSSTVVGDAFFGETVIGNVNPAFSPPGSTIFANASTPLSTGVPIFSLNTPLYLMPVPEPATVALAGLGGLSLLLFRRQRK